MDAAAWHAQRTATLWSVKGYRLRETYPPQARWWWRNQDRQPADSVVAQYIRRGRLVLREGGKDRELGPGQLFLFAYAEDSCYGRPPDRPDWPGHADHLQMDHVTLHGSGLRAHWELLRARQGSVITLDPESACLHALGELCSDDPSHGQTEPMVRVAAFVATLAKAIEASAGAARPPVERAVEQILANPYAEHNLKSVAESCGCSREHLSRVFLERVGEPPMAWMRRRRLERALELLRETDLTVRSIALQCGAGSVHRLARWTQTTHGLAPKALAQRLRRDRPVKRV